LGVAAFDIHVPLDFFTVVIAAGAAGAIYFFKTHPALLIVASMFIGYIVF